VDYIPNARLFVVPDGGHWLFGHTEVVVSGSTEFLSNNVAIVKDHCSRPPAIAQGECITRQGGETVSQNKFPFQM
jgi:hypothetical protein